MPLAAALTTARLIASGFDRVVPKLRRVAIRNLELAGFGSRPDIVDGVFESLARLLVSFAKFPNINRENIHQWIRYEGFEHYAAAKQRGRGVLFATGHLGNWELSAFAHALLTEPMNVLVRPLDNSVIDNFVERRRALSGNRIITKKEAARTILRALQNNEAVGILVDQNSMLNEGVFIDFFGVPACTNATFVRLAARSGAAVIPGFALWSTEERRYILRFLPPVEMTGDTQRDTQRLHHEIEQVIRAHPEQWLWIHRSRMLDVRVATLPTVEGEAVVMRLLDKSKKPPTLEEVGLGIAMTERLMPLIHRPTGALLVTGPTGSGKSTTLFAAASNINRPEIKVITVEDPVEYRLAGLNQVQIDPRAGLTFATALRSILRSDPDVVMVGEIRDVETAKISIEAALTGHFVLSTMHTNDAPSALTRLNEMGVEPFLTGAAVTGVLAQRLARRLCEHCKEMYVPTEEEINSAKLPEELRDGNVELYRRTGCGRCRQTGYRGRIGVFQLLTMNEEVSALAARKASREELERAAMTEGMTTLWADGIEKVLAGLTSLGELRPGHDRLTSERGA